MNAPVVIIDRKKKIIYEKNSAVHKDYDRVALTGEEAGSLAKSQS